MAFVVVANLDDIEVGLQDGVRAEGEAARHFGQVEPDLRFEPKPFLIDQANHGRGCAADLRRQTGQIVERFFRGGVEDVVLAQRPKAFGFIAGSRGGFHMNLRPDLLLTTRYTAIRPVSQ